MTVCHSRNLQRLVVQTTHSRLLVVVLLRAVTLVQCCFVQSLRSVSAEICNDDLSQQKTAATCCGAVDQAAPDPNPLSRVSCSVNVGGTNLVP